MRKLINVFPVLLMFLIVAAMYFVYIYDSSHHSEGEYLSLTTSQLTGSDELEATVYEYNLHTNKISEVYRFPVNAMYSLGVYDKAKNRVFYVQERDNNTFERKHLGDQIYMHDLSTGEDSMLTDDLLAVNIILPVDDIVFFLAAKLDHPDLVVGRIDLTTGDVRYWNESPSVSSRVLSIDRERERLYVSMYDVEEDNAYFRSGVMPAHTIYSYDYNLSDKREILRAENMCIRSVDADDNVLMYNVLDTFVPPIATYALTRVIDLDSMEVLFETDDSFSQGRLATASEAGTYLFADTGDFDGIAYLDFATQEYTPVIQNGQNMSGEIVNFQVMRTAG